jgi:hypothetical protein
MKDKDKTGRIPPTRGTDVTRAFSRRLAPRDYDADEGRKTSIFSKENVRLHSGDLSHYDGLIGLPQIFQREGPLWI